MKTFCKAHDAEPGGILCTALLQDEALRDISNDAKVLYALLLDRASISWQNGTIWLYFNLGTGTDKAPPQPLERHANLPGIGVQRFDRSAQAGPGQARPHHAELPGGRKTHSAERGWCKTVRLKVENKDFFCSASSANHRGMSFPITTQQSVSMRLQKR